MKTLQLSLSDRTYLLAIDELGGRGTRISDIAARLCVTKASVCRAVDKLAAMELVARNEHHQVLLTPVGKHISLEIKQNTDIIQEFITKILMLGDNVDTGEVLALENAMSQETICSLKEYMEVNWMIAEFSALI